MSTHCFIPVLGKRLRVTTLDDCGNYPAPGTADSWIATDGFITVNLTSEVEDGAEIITKKADGSLCVNEKLAASFKRFMVEVEFCGVNPSLLGFVSNATPYEDAAGDVAGFTVAEGIINKQFALELWTGLSGEGCAPGEESAGGYLLLPYVHAGVLGDIAIDGEKAVTFSMKSAYTKGGNNWGAGPYNVVANIGGSAYVLPTALDALDHLLLMDTSINFPPSACNPQAMDPKITSISPATGVAAGGTTTTILGGGFTGATAVNFASTPGTSFTVVNDGKITVTSPAHAAGAVTVTVVRPAGNLTLPAGFLYT